MVKRKNNFCVENYTKSWNYIKESKNFMYVVLIIFIFFIFMGFFIPAPEILIEKILEFIESLLLKTEGMNFSELTMFIFFNNLQSSFLGMVFGIILGIFPVISIVANGYLLGFVASRTVQAESIFVLWRLIPHGIFELPALIISLGLGLRLGTFIFQKKKIESLKNCLWNSLRVFLFVIIPLLLIAALVEGILIFLLK